MDLPPQSHEKLRISLEDFHRLTGSLQPSRNGEWVQDKAVEPVKNYLLSSQRDSHRLARSPAMNRWAIFGRPYRTSGTGCSLFLAPGQADDDLKRGKGTRNRSDSVSSKRQSSGSPHSSHRNRQPVHDERLPPKTRRSGGSNSHKVEFAPFGMSIEHQEIATLWNFATAIQMRRLVPPPSAIHFGILIP